MLIQSLFRHIHTVHRSRQFIYSTAVRVQYSRTMSSNTTSSTHPFTESSIAESFLHFINSSPTQFHAVESVVNKLHQHNYIHISERTDDWSTILQPGKSYYYTRNQSTLVAFTLGKHYKYNTCTPFVITAAHTDSPVLKVKPISKLIKSGYHSIGVECYGGGLWHTWLDRDLSIAGRVIIKQNNKYISKLVDLVKPIIRIPNLAIHLSQGGASQTDGLKLNKQTHLQPIITTAIKQQLNEKKKPSDDKSGASNNKSIGTQSQLLHEQHHNILLELIADKLQVEIDCIRDFELCLYDTQPAQLGGAYNEFILSRGLDNLMSTFITINSLVDLDTPDDNSVHMAVLFDNEEIGSESTNGAASTLLLNTLTRISGVNTISSSLASSYLISCDMAHAVHPNYAEQHDENHRPVLHGGLVIKTNVNQRYATNMITEFALIELADKHNIPIQRFSMRNDFGCGSTVGPILSANTGIRTVDVGVAQLSMHSIREMCGTSDVYTTYQLMKHIFNEFISIDQNMVVSDEYKTKQ